MPASYVDAGIFRYRTSSVINVQTGSSCRKLYFFYKPYVKNTARPKSNAASSGTPKPRDKNNPATKIPRVSNSAIINSKNNSYP